jgi:glutamate dehydrogenase
MQETIDLIEAQDRVVSAAVQEQMMWQVSRLVRRGVRWLLRHRKEYLNNDNIAATIAHFTPGVAALRDDLADFFVGNERERWQAMVDELKAAAVPEAVAKRIAGLRRQYALLDIIEAAADNQLELADVARIYFAIGEHLGFSWLREQITRQPVDSRWDVLGRAAMRDDLDGQQRRLAVVVLGEIGPLLDITTQLDKWFSQHKNFIVHWQQLITDLRAVTDVRMMMLSVVVRELVGLVRVSRQMNGRKLSKTKRG